MRSKIKKLLQNQGENYLLPFFWQHGEDEEILRDYMRAIDENHIKAVCIESRPHPDFCGPKWWEDMDVILDEAKKRNMKVWILDDSHFPSGYANGAMANQPDELCRQSICSRTYVCREGDLLSIEKEQLLHPDPFRPTRTEMFIGEKNPREYHDDRLLSLFAFPISTEGTLLTDEGIDLKNYIVDDALTWTVPTGQWKIYAMHLTRNMGFHRSYINMMDQASCKVLLDAVYEQHYERYKDEFGTTIAGFFSDEPELGNGHIYDKKIKLGDHHDFPWSYELENALKETMGNDFPHNMVLLWEEDADDAKKAKVRYTYMDLVTRLVETNFSMQIGNWCRDHKVQYIGHLIEDDNAHARTGSSLGHFYRGLAGQDMAGIDDIGGQVFPQGEDINLDNGPFQSRIGEFFHYMLGKLGNSAAAIDPLKNGNAMCEIFGAYGWSAGLHLEKYLMDHFLVRGINYFVPHAYSPKAYPDPDCPPHFYAGGHNPQHRHFGELMAYTNRSCELITGGHHVAPVAVLYHGESEWTGECMLSHNVGHILADMQVDYDYLPQDVFRRPTYFKTEIRSNSLTVHTQSYKAFIIPESQFITVSLAEAIVQMIKAGIKVCFMNKYPEGICDVETEDTIVQLLLALRDADLVRLEDLSDYIQEQGLYEVKIQPQNNRLRYYHYEHQDGSTVYFFVNEGTTTYNGTVLIGDERKAYAYNAWDNQIEEATYIEGALSLNLEPLKSYILVFDTDSSSNQELKKPLSLLGEKVTLSESWNRSICKSIDYPDFVGHKEITMPDQLTTEEPEFSGYAKYERTVELSHFEQVVLEITAAYEGVEVFVNDYSCGIQIVPTYLFDITKACRSGSNTIRIEVATTLERENANTPNLFGQVTPATGLSGITGEVNLYIQG